MNKGLVIYKSKYGSVKKYAYMVKEELECDICDVRNCDEFMLDKYNWIVYAGGIYAGGIAGLNTMKKYYNRIKNQKAAILCVGASPYDEKAINEIRIHNLRGSLERIPLFYGRGAWDESIMSLKDRTLCKMLKTAVAKKDPASCEPWMRELLSSMGKKCDWTDKNYLIPLVEYIKSEDLRR